MAKEVKEAKVEKDVLPKHKKANQFAIPLTTHPSAARFETANISMFAEGVLGDTLCMLARTTPDQRLEELVHRLPDGAVGGICSVPFWKRNNCRAIL